MRSFDAILPAAILLLGMGSFSAANAPGAQQTPQLPTAQQQRPPVLPGSTRSGTEDEDNPMARQLAEQQAKRRNNQRQKEIVDDTARLLQLAQQLKDDVDKGKTPGDSSFTKKAGEIERLAKSVKEKMREGQ